MSYLKRMFLNNLAVCLCYTMLFSVLMYAFTVKIASTEINNRAQTTVAQLASYVDNCISKSLNSAVFINGNSFINDYANETEPNYYNRMKVREFLRDSVSFLPGRESFVAITHENDRSVITNSASMYIDVFAKNIDITMSELDSLKAAARSGSNNSIHYTISDSGQKSILTMLTCESSKYNQPLYIFICLKMDELIDNSADDMNLLITADDEILYTSPDTPDDLTSSVLSGDTPKNHQIFTKNSSAAQFLGNLTYYSVIPKKLYRQRLTDKFILLSAIFAVLLIISLAVVYLITKRTYAPIAGLLDVIDTGRPDKNRNEIDYLKNKFLSLSQRNEQLSTILDKYKTPLEEAFLKDVLYGSISKSVMNEKIHEYGSAVTLGTFITAIVETSGSEMMLENASGSSISVLNRTVSGMFRDHFVDYRFFRILRLGSDKYALIAAIDELEDFKRDLRRFLLQASENTGINLFASLGTAVNNMMLLSESFSVALNVAENRIYGMQYSTLCTPDDVSAFNGSSIYYPFDTEAAVIENVAAGNTEAVHRLTHTLISANFIHKPFSAEQFSQFIFMFTATFNRIFSALNKKCSDIFPDDVIIYLELKSCHKPDELLEKINYLLDEIANSVQTQLTSMDSRSRKLMLEFIEKNYTRDISLLDLAEYMNFSGVHTSRLFKSLVGQNFKEYLTRFRFEKAKEIINTMPHMKIKDIAEAVGCSSTAILSRSFVKYAGMSAGQYIKKHS